MKNKKNISKKIGSLMAAYLGRNFSADFLSENLPNIFGDIADCRYVNEEEFSKVKTLLNQRTEEPKVVKKPKKTAVEILSKLGYDLLETKTKAEYMPLKRYFHEADVLCKFDGYNACERYGRLFWIIRKDIDKINRPKEGWKRQDQYSTSCMSVGISRDLKNVSQICSRYNHRVSGCDNVHNSNLDNIVDGLKDAFNRDYGLKLGASHGIELTQFYVMDGKYHYYSHEISGKKISGTCIDGVYYNPDYQIIFDNYILDIKKRNIVTIDGHEDGFVTATQDLLNKGYPVIIKTTDDGEDDENKIIIYKQ